MSLNFPALGLTLQHREHCGGVSRSTWAVGPIPLNVWRKAITAEPYVPNLKTLREKIDQDTTLLGSLDPNSDAYSRLQARIAAQTTQLLDYEDVLAQRRQQAAQLADQRARRETETSGIAGGLLFALVGLVLTVACWGTGWLVLGIILLIIGIGTAITSAQEPDPHRDA